MESSAGEEYIYPEGRNPLRRRIPGREIQRRRDSDLSDGASYSGSWRDDQPSGKGRLRSSNGDIYEGDFVGGKFDGYGRLTQANGNRYEGYWRNHKKNGKGRYTFANGTVWEGRFIDDGFVVKNRMLCSKAAI
jgi:hypothetical protein